MHTLTSCKRWYIVSGKRSFNPFLHFSVASKAIPTCCDSLTRLFFAAAAFAAAVRGFVVRLNGAFVAGAFDVSTGGADARRLRMEGGTMVDLSNHPIQNKMNRDSRHGLEGGSRHGKE
jgi:hypothetical protein